MSMSHKRMASFNRLVWVSRGIYRSDMLGTDFQRVVLEPTTFVACCSEPLNFYWRGVSRTKILDSALSSAASSSPPHIPVLPYRPFQSFPQFCGLVTECIFLSPRANTFGPGGTSMGHPAFSRAACATSNSIMSLPCIRQMAHTTIIYHEVG